VTTGLVAVEACQVCGGSESSLVFEEPPYTVRRCAACTLVWVSPRHSDDSIHEVYGASYWRSDSPKTKGYADYANEAPLYLKTFKKRLRFVRRFVPERARVLDVGCAAGYFLRVMRDAGHDVFGVEVSAAIARDAIREVGSDRVHVGTLDTAPADRGFRAGSFDLVTMWDVVEHVPDPQALLRQARAMLKPSGHLLLETQNVDSRFANLLKERWHHYKHEEHIYHFNPSTVRRLLEQSGFEPVRMTSAYGGKYVSFGFIAERAARLNRVASMALRPLALLKRCNVYLNLHDELVVAAKLAGPTAGGRLAGSAL
jgi:2-polyprenyl-3-methyl-5-hydroxy-6-metoxy-1,4-benzoquinol methylase